MPETILHQTPAAPIIVWSGIDYMAVLIPSYNDEISESLEAEPH
jgi:hypothetical protein